MRTFKILLQLLIVFMAATGSSQDLQDYLVMAGSNNPRVKAAYARFEAGMQKVPQVNSLPDPTLTMSAFGQMVQTRVGAQEAKFSLMQMFPWFGTLSAKSNAATLMAEAEFQKYIDSRNEVFMEVKNLYAEIYELHKLIELEKQNLEILDTYRELALSKFSNNKGSMVDVVKIDIKRDETKANIELLKDRDKPLLIAFNSLLNREPGMSVEISENLNLNESIMDEKQDSLFMNSPKMVMLDKEIASFEAQKQAIDKSSLPMIGIGIDYAIISKRDVPDLDMNGQDVIMPMLSVSLPVFGKKYSAAKKEADLRIEANNYQKEAVEDKLYAEYSMAKYDLKKANRLLELYDTQIGNTRIAINLSMTAYSNADSGFEDVLKLSQDLLMFNTARLRALKDRFKAQSKIEYLVANTEDYENSLHD